MIEMLFRKGAVGSLWALGYTGAWFIWRSAFLAVDQVGPPWLVDPTWYSFMLATAVVSIVAYFTAKFFSR